MTNTDDAPAHLPLINTAAHATQFTNAHTACCSTGKPVADDMLTSIRDLATWAPTTSHTQPIRIHYLRTPASRQRLIP